MLRVVILISGRGSNMEAVLRARDAQALQFDVVAVVSNRADAAGLGLAGAHGIATAVVSHGEHATRTSFEAVLARTIDSFDPGLVVLAGFMRILTADFVGRYAGRLLNIHPSLLPAFPGLGTHERALATGCKVHGATVHFVTADLDHGPIVAQAVVPVLRGDDPVSLAARVLAQEHILYPRAIDWFARGLLRIENDLVRVTDPGVRQWIMA